MVASPDPPSAWRLGRILDKIPWWPLRVPARFCYRMVFGVAGIATALGVAGFIAAIARLDLVPAGLRIALLGLAAIRAAYETGAAEAERGTVTFREDHIREMQRVAGELRDWVARRADTRYRVVHEATRRSELAALTSHYPWLGLDELDRANALAAQASERVHVANLERARAAGYPAPATQPPVGAPILGVSGLLDATVSGGVAVPLQWDAVRTKTGLSLRVRPPNWEVIDVGGLTADEVLETERTIGELVAAALDSPEVADLRRAEKEPWRLAVGLVNQLSHLALQELPAGTRCDHCDPPRAVIRGGRRSPRRPIRDLILRRPSQGSGGRG